jgi:hypothetical protein
MKRIFTFLLITLFFVIITQAQQGKSGKIGIGYSGNFTSRTNDLSVSIWANDNITIEPQVGFQTIKIEDNSVSSFKLGIGILFRLSNSPVFPYVGVRVKDEILSGGDESYSDLKFTGAFGGEYFISEWFSVGAEMRLNVVKTDKDYSPSYGVANATIFETEQVLNLRIYLK